MVQASSGDKLYLVEQATPTHERIDAAVKRVQKSTPSAKVALAPGLGKHKGGGHDGGGKKKWKEAKQQHQHYQQIPHIFPPGFGGGFGQGGKPARVLGGGSSPICFTCGLPRHIVANFHKK